MRQLLAQHSSLWALGLILGVMFSPGSMRIKERVWSTGSLDDCVVGTEERTALLHQKTEVRESKEEEPGRPVVVHAFNPESPGQPGKSCLRMAVETGRADAKPRPWAAM